MLRRLILEEFKDNKLIKLPQEYDIYDSDEEARTKEREGNDPQLLFNKESHKNFYSLKELERPRIEKVNQISQMFDEKLKSQEDEKAEYMKKTK